MPLPHTQVRMVWFTLHTAAWEACATHTYACPFVSQCVVGRSLSHVFCLLPPPSMPSPTCLCPHYLISCLCPDLPLLPCTHSLPYHYQLLFMPATFLPPSPAFSACPCMPATPCPTVTLPTTWPYTITCFPCLLYTLSFLCLCPLCHTYLLLKNFTTLLPMPAFLPYLPSFCLA